MMHNDEHACCGGGHCHTGDDDSQELSVHEVMEEVGQLLGSIDSVIADTEMTAEEKIAAIDEMLDPWRPEEENDEE